MAKSKVLLSEKYEVDVFSEILSNLHQKVKRRYDSYIWGPIDLSASGKRFCETDLENQKAEFNIERGVINFHEQKMTVERSIQSNPVNIEREEIEQTNDEKNCSYFSTSSRILNEDVSNIDKGDQNVKMSQLVEQIPASMTTNPKKRTVSESDSEKMEKSRKNTTSEVKKHVSAKKYEFRDWCDKRSKEYEDSKTKATVNQPTMVSPASYSVPEKKIITTQKQQLLSTKEYSNNSSNKRSKEYENSKTKATINQLTMESPASYSVPEKKIITTQKQQRLSTKEYSNNSSNDGVVKDLMKDICSEKMTIERKNYSLLCIKLTDENEDKKYEFMMEIANFSRIKRIYQKFFEILPDVDSGSNKIYYSIEAVNLIFRYMFNQGYNFDSLSSPVIGVEVLAATQAWEIDKFHANFQKDFLQKVLMPSNIQSVFSLASHFGLKQICDACLSISQNNLNCSTNKRQKTCWVTISTYIEPLEHCISFHPTEIRIKNSFDRHILNTIVFKSFSGCYTITGFQIQLNEDYLQKRSSNDNMLKIDCRIKNVRLNQRVEKPLRPINIIYFKKGLVVNPGQTSEITVETDIKPHLCSSSLDVKTNVRNSEGAFELSVLSDYKDYDSDTKIFLIGKIFYHVEKEPKGSKK